MANEVQLDEPADLLLTTARRVVPLWLRRVTTNAGTAGGVDVAAIRPDLDAMVEQSASDVLERLERLLRTDVDRQATTPLSLLRDAVAAPTGFLSAHGAVPPGAPVSSGHGFPEDVYRLGPATWSDVDPDLHLPGLTWGAWKAMTVLTRRRDEGLR